MVAEQLLFQYLTETYTMQLSTSNGSRPWTCSVYFVADEQHNIFWASLPTRRHSQEILKNPRVSCAVVVQNVIGEPVIGIQIEGSAKIQQPSEKYRLIAETYAAKFKRNPEWVEHFIAGDTEHRLYKLSPSAIWLFDEQNFPGGNRLQLL